MAGSNILSDIMNLNDFDLNSHLNTYMDDIDEIDNPLSNLAINSKYYDITDLRIDSQLNGHKHQLTALHINIQSLSAKFDELKSYMATLHDNNIKLDGILICETVLLDSNTYLYELPVYSFVYKNRSTMSRGGVCIYINESIQFKLRDDLAVFVDCEFELIFIETTNTPKKHNSRRNISDSQQHFKTLIGSL